MLKTFSHSNELSSKSVVAEADRERILTAVYAAFETQVGFLSELLRCVSPRG